jgi:hypothetical protein
MRNVLLFLAVAALAIPAAAREIELTPIEVAGSGQNGFPDQLTRTEEELVYDSGSTGYYCNWAPLSIRLGKWFEAGYPCYVVRYRVNYYYISGTENCHAYFYDDEGGSPDEGTLYWDETFNPATTGFNWYDLDVDPPQYDGDGDFFGTFAWDDTVSTGGPGCDLTITYPGHDFQYYSGWGDGWYQYYIRAVVDDDVDPPYVDGQDPPDGGGGAPDTDIVFHCKDDDKGVDSSTIGFSADDGTKADVSGSLDIDDGDPNDVVCTFTPDSDLPEGTITCTVAGTLADGLGNEMGSDAVWSFVVDATPPTITQEYPTGGRAGGGAPATRAAVRGGATVSKAILSDGGTRTAGPDTNIGWHIEDNAAGCLFADCVYSVKVGGVDVPVAENVTDDGTTDVTVELDPNSDFNPGDVVDVSVQATDMAGNTMDAPYEWSFTVGYVNVDEASLGEIKAGYH